MEQNNNLNKKIGIWGGLATIIIVGASTFLAERKTPVSSIAELSSQISSKESAVSDSATNSTAVAQNLPAVTKKSVKSTSTNGVSKNSRGGENEESEWGGEDNEGVPVVPKTTTAVATPPAIVPKQSASIYKNGSYSAIGSYSSPGGQDQISVALTLTNDIITDITVTSVSGDRTSIRYQNNFIAGYKQYVIGKNIANVNLSVVSGSSLTPAGFNDAITQIMAQAKA